MKKHIVIIHFLLLLVIVGCGTLYGVAVEERKTGTIAADAKIAAAIQKGFLEDSDVKALDISAYCYNGNVYLVGEYDRAPQKERAITIAEGIEGVRSVHTYILLKKKSDKCGTSDNLAIRGKVDAKLVADKDIWSTNIDIKVVQCNVVLLGIVKTGREITKATAHAKSVEGVRSVTSYLNSTH
jgi:hyperosmotically inducible periplasmic protein